VGNIYVSGAYFERFVWDGITADTTTSTTRFVAKLDRYGQCMWIRPLTTTGRTYIQDLAVTRPDNAYVLVAAEQTLEREILSLSTADSTYVLEYEGYFVAHLGMPSSGLLRGENAHGPLAQQSSMNHQWYTPLGRMVPNTLTSGHLVQPGRIPAGIYLSQRGGKYVRLYGGWQGAKH